ncbi:hypothetical protein V6615_15120 [Oscillospiraceae bacterium PP1C4]
MKKKVLVISGVVLVSALTIGFTAYGANELGLLGGTNTENVVSTLQVESSNDSDQTYRLAVSNQFTAQQTQVASVNENLQEITTELEAYRYPVLTVQKGIPVKWTISANADNLSPCNNELIIPAYGISKKLNVGENVIEFTPTDTGVIPYSCWMGMINGSIAVVDDINNYDANIVQEQINNLPRSGCCG